MPTAFVEFVRSTVATSYSRVDCFMSFVVLQTSDCILCLLPLVQNAVSASQAEVIIWDFCACSSFV